MYINVLNTGSSRPSNDIIIISSSGNYLPPYIQYSIFFIKIRGNHDLSVVCGISSASQFFFFVTGRTTAFKMSNGTCVF